MRHFILFALINGVFHFHNTRAKIDVAFFEAVDLTADGVPRIRLSGLLLPD